MSSAADPAIDAVASRAGARIVVTGAAGTLGAALLEHLNGAVVVAVDREAVAGPATTRIRADLLTADLAPVVAGATAIVHLAASPDCALDDPQCRRSLAITRRVIDAATAAGVPRIVRPSSTSVYGAWANNPDAITEEAPLRPSPGFAPARADAECERLLADWAAAGPDRFAVRPRLAPVVGGERISALAAAALGWAPVRVRGARPSVQVLHVDDAGAALAALALGPPVGVVNLAAEGTLSPVGGGPRIPGLSVSAAARALDACWAAGRFGAPGAIVPYLVHPFTVSTERAQAAGLVPGRSARVAGAAIAARPGRGRRAAVTAAAGVFGAEASRLRRRAGGGSPSRPTRT